MDEIFFPEEKETNVQVDYFKTLKGIQILGCRAKAVEKWKYPGQSFAFYGRFFFLFEVEDL